MKKARSHLPAIRALPCGLILTLLLTALSVDLGAQDTTTPVSSVSTSVAAPVALTLKRAIELALQNSKDIQVARLQATLADRSAMITKSQFLPNLYAGSGACFPPGIPEPRGAPAPPLFSVTYQEEFFNEPLRG